MMHGHLITDIGLAIIAAALIGFPFYYLGIPLLLAYLIAGVLLGPHLGLSFIQDSASISNISEIGLVLLMFILGLEINIKKLLQTGKTVLITGSVQITMCLLMALLYFWFFGFRSDNYDWIYLAVACTLSSTLLVVKILSDQMDLDSLPSRVTLGILVLQDFFAIGFLALQPNLANLNFNTLLISFAKVILLMSISWLLARFVLPTLFKKSSRQPELMLILAMAWCFSMCGTANYLDLSLEMGALVAGISIASFPYHLDVAAKISSLRDFFITLFFVSLGLQIPQPSWKVVQIASLIVLFVTFSRILTIYPVMHRMGYANRASLMPAINLSQLSEFALVLATLGYSMNHISKDLLSAFVLALVFSALLSSFLIPWAHTIYKTLNPFLEKIGFHDHVSDFAKKEQDGRLQNNHSLVLLGFYREASSLLYEMQSRCSQDFMDKIVVVDFNPEAHQELKKLNIQSHYGDISSVDTLRSLNLQNSKMIISTISDKYLKGITNLQLLKILKKLAPESCIIVTADTLSSAAQMYESGANYVYIPRIIGASYLMGVIERLQINGATSIQADAISYIQQRSEIVT